MHCSLRCSAIRPLQIVSKITSPMDSLAPGAVMGLHLSAASSAWDRTGQSPRSCCIGCISTKANMELLHYRALATCCMCHALGLGVVARAVCDSVVKVASHCMLPLDRYFVGKGLQGAHQAPVKEPQQHASALRSCLCTSPLPPGFNSEHAAHIQVPCWKRLCKQPTRRLMRTCSSTQQQSVQHSGMQPTLYAALLSAPEISAWQVSKVTCRTRLA